MTWSCSSYSCSCTACSLAQGAIELPRDDACRSCHAAQVESFHKTAHFLTSSDTDPTHPSSANFAPGENILKTSNPNLSFHMDAKGNFFTANCGSPQHRALREIRLVIGSGDKGQTYLFWDEDQLFQLPVSYWKDWLGKQPRLPRWLRGLRAPNHPPLPGMPRDLFRSTAAARSNRYNTTGYSLGIQCEKCHGPGQRARETGTSEVRLPIPPS